ncbi:hypothetical protein PLICRDRAFT_110958 [Plicaturopsis crispa FD-325 SS-3]|nr:hypothetical protein PLICRDRAFT_110958 [Plicaturopsis crispa FD-325 SS-3]
MNPVRAKDPQRKGNDASSSRRVVYDATPVATTGELEKDSRRRDRERFKSRGSLVSHTYGENATLGATRSSSAGASSNTASNVRRAKQRARPRIEVYIPTVVSVGMLARLLKVRLETLQRKMAQAGMGQESHYDYVLTSDYAVLLAEEFNRKPIVSDEAAFDIYPSPTHPNPSTLPARPPVVTIMGHVDHGKTTLLDTLRHSAVAKGEAGGITQHIGAFSVPVPSGNAQGPQSITFLDTPGHAAFSAMRARGASVTDIIVLVVAADDGVMPQTKEVIELIRKDAGKVGVVVAINKVDKLGADVEKVQMALVQEGIQLESIGGDVPSVEVSGLTGQGLDTLVETLSLMAEMQDLHAERDGPAHGYVLESRVEKGLGPVATVLVTRGCLKTAAHIISGTSQAKVRIMKDQVGAAVKAAYPGMAVTVSGWKELPSAGDEVLQGSEADVKKALANRVRKEKVEATLVDVEAINVNRREERERKEIEDKDAKTRQGLASAPVEEVEHGPRQLRLVVKGDVSGSVEAVVGAIESIGNKDAVVKIVSNGVGDVSETDVMMAKTAGAMIVAFSVNVPRAMEVLAAQNEVPIYSTPIIYRLMDEVRDRIIALLPKTIETTVTGEANVLQLFDVSVKGKITKKVAGCRVSNGIADKANKARVVRNGTIVHAGTIETLRYLKKDVTEIRKGSECGMAFTQFEDIREGDLIQFYREVEVPGVL